MRLFLFVQPDVSPSGEKGYIATCYKLDIVSQGDTEAEALKNLKEAIDLFLEDADADEVKRRLNTNPYREPRDPTYGIEKAAPRTWKKCKNCCHFHQSGMAAEAGVGYCFKWTRQRKFWVMTSPREICPQFFWRLPPGINTIWMFFDMHRLETLGHCGSREPAEAIEVDLGWLSD